MKLIVIVLIVAVNIQCEPSSSNTRKAEAKNFIESSYDRWSDAGDSGSEPEVDSNESSSGRNSEWSTRDKSRPRDYVQSSDSSPKYNFNGRFNQRKPPPINNGGSDSEKGSTRDKNEPDALSKASNGDDADSEETSTPDFTESVPINTPIPDTKTLQMLNEPIANITGSDGTISVDGLSVVSFEPEFGSHHHLVISAEGDGIHINDRYTYFKTWRDDSLADLKIDTYGIERFALYVYSDGSFNYADDSKQGTSVQFIMRRRFKNPFLRY